MYRRWFRQVVLEGTQLYKQKAKKQSVEMSGPSAADLSALKSVDTSKIEVDDDQAPPKVAAFSDEEKALCAKVKELLLVYMSADEAAAVSEDDMLMCLRGRKYDATRAAELVPAFLGVKKEFSLGKGSEQLTEDFATRVPR